MSAQSTWMPRPEMAMAAGPSSYLRAEEALATFRNAMRRLAGHVHVVTTCLNGERGGLTATAVCSLTAQPPRILACINLSGRSYRMIAESRVMAVNVLGTEHEALARRFATASGADPFDGGERWTQAATGAPLLELAQASFDCTVDQMLMTGTHAIVIGEIRHISHRDTGTPLLYVNGEFRGAGPLDLPFAASASEQASR
ncbi:flavin reductase family protein [Variovorax sp.]|uniref:flavin reductase family protein n=1 Tax=Variovorax sp. TaxID=1871043 RepID=UPI0025E40A6B|nr:flavin reductase family protein [Variovorax sp.]